uniref:Protochlorophyllide reductase n=1 Tax=Pyramimonas obovata TaxID=1411642 RepID=A0A7S0RAS4_9CHLO|mmetsp:Transcript_29887/g.65319  ORF Transcript_29887/g.65319 Transcript_29887/m.65319 type:complete len:308 (+) Transcript_29887:189-1112(+)|eukprot:CAMPEP_0118925360 /NCGR_PEP_ID=MMETSP1169-20130426/3246_1 /TAXON_ID=36882 /ORGANISM="Pyramimonas obovata, Strain CCMP722" /LENGTH=307 /DNA_ID=CAMNT_0006866623 /DNA_START=185 /DNA_END=1108 /DNA_ORIENTATION=-
MAMANKLCIVSGANSGIGRVIATELAQMQARVIMACRSEERTLPVVKDIKELTGNQNVEYWPLDLASLASVRSFAKRVGESPVGVDVLVSNAGIMNGKRELTADGFETNWQVNALAPFLLARLLLPSLSKAATTSGGSSPSRLVYVGSMLDKKGDLSDLDTVADPKRRFDASNREKFSPFDTYGTAKLAATLLHTELARQAQAEHPGVCINVVSPGVVNTHLFQHMLPPWAKFMTGPIRFFLSFVMISPFEGAKTPLAVATSPEEQYLVTGKYFRNLHQMDRQDTIPIDDVALATKLWETCDAMAPP